MGGGGECWRWRGKGDLDRLLLPLMILQPAIVRQARVVGDVPHPLAVIAAGKPNQVDGIGGTGVDRVICAGLALQGSALAGAQRHVQLPVDLEVPGEVPIDWLDALARIYGLTGAALLAKQDAGIVVLAAIDQASAVQLAHLRDVLDELAE